MRSAKITCGAIAATGVLAGAALAASGFDIDAIAGVYKHRFTEETVDGEKYPAENVLEVVKVSPTTAYIRTHLDFYNGHACDVWGIAKIEGDALVYRSTKDVSEGLCVLNLKPDGGKMVFRDEDGRCFSYYCSARGVLNGVEFPLSSRRPIRYMARLVGSREYADALQELRTGQPQ
jgi:hypothetical protein